MVILELGTENQKSISAGRIIPAFLLLFSLYSTVVFANRISGEYNFSKALSYQARGNFVGMLRSVRNAGNKYYTTDNSSTPLDWYKGFAMFYQGNDSAMYYYQRAEEQNPYHVQTISDIGALLENQGKHEEAIKYFNRVLAFVPNYYQAHYNLAVAYFNLGRMPEALHEINARFVVGDEYLNTRDVILARSAELIVDSCDKTGKTRDIATNKLLLRKINDQSLEVHTTFGSILCDTISHRLRRLPG